MKKIEREQQKQKTRGMFVLVCETNVSVAGSMALAAIPRALKVLSRDF